MCLFRFYKSNIVSVIAVEMVNTFQKLIPSFTELSKLDGGRLKLLIGDSNNIISIESLW